MSTDSTASLTEKTAFLVPEDIVFRNNPDGTVVVMKMDNSDIFFKIDGVAAEVWNQLEQGNSFGEIKDHVLKTYDVSEEKFHQDADSLIAELLNKNLVQQK